MAASKSSSITSMAQMDDFIANEIGIKDQALVLRPASSGVDVLDIYNGRYFINKDNEPELYQGVPRGKVIGSVGYTGVGKTTILVQAGMAQIAPYAENHAMLHHFDLENAWSYERTAEISGLDIDSVKQIYRRYPQYSINKIYNFIKKLIRVKKTLMEDPHSDVWVTDHVTGERIPVPTIILIDTVAALQTEDVLNEKDEFGSFLAEPGAQAKANNMFIQRLAGMIGEVNISIMWINHIRSKVDVGPVKTAKRIQQMGGDETIPGGEGFPQYTDFMIRITGTEVLTPAEGFGINGKVVTVRMIKSRQAYDGRTFDMVLTNRGFDNDWTNLQFMRKNKLLSGGGAHQFLTDASGNSTRKFALRNFKTLMETDQEFAEVANQAFADHLIGIVPEYSAPDNAFENDGVEEVYEDLE